MNFRGYILKDSSSFTVETANKFTYPRYYVVLGSNKLRQCEICRVPEENVKRTLHFSVGGNSLSVDSAIEMVDEICDLGILMETMDLSRKMRNCLKRLETSNMRHQSSVKEKKIDDLKLKIALSGYDDSSFKTVKHARGSFFTQTSRPTHLEHQNYPLQGQKTWKYPFLNYPSNSPVKWSFSANGNFLKILLRHTDRDLSKSAILLENVANMSYWLSHCSPKDLKEALLDWHDPNANNHPDCVTCQLKQKRPTVLINKLGMISFDVYKWSPNWLIFLKFSGFPIDILTSIHSEHVQLAPK